jgi:CRP-like cAMP-binding protein
LPGYDPGAVALDWRLSVDFLELLHDDTRARVLESCRRVTHRAGHVAEFPREAASGVIESGLVRGYQVAEDGREATVGYLYPREYLGSLHALMPQPVVFIQNVTDTVVLQLPDGMFKALIEANVDFAHAFAVHTTTLLARMVRVVTVRTLGTVRQRLAFDLLERATEKQLRSGLLEFEVTQQQLAGGIGTAREVVSIELGELRDEGIVSTRPRHVRIEDPARLASILRFLTDIEVPA